MRTRATATIPATDKAEVPMLTAKANGMGLFDACWISAHAHNIVIVKGNRKTNVKPNTVPARFSTCSGGLAALHTFR